MVSSEPKSANEYGDSIDYHAWSMLVVVMRNAITVVVFFTPTASTYRCEASVHDPTLQALNGQGWSGLPRSSQPRRSRLATRV